MVHGEISGKLRWDEVRKIDMVGALFARWPARRTDWR